jgi:hypothetical protein
MAGPPIAFVAYSSRDAALAKLIADAVYVANGKSDRVRYETWVYNDIPGNPLISPILDRIEESAFIIADVTTLNLNVVYEIAFAIGRRKRAYLIRHRGTAGDKAVAREAGIFDTWAITSTPKYRARAAAILGRARPPSTRISCRAARKGTCGDRDDRAAEEGTVPIPELHPWRGRSTIRRRRYTTSRLVVGTSRHA